MYQTSTFKPAWWLSNAHLQTMAAKWLRRKLQLTTIDEILTTPDDDLVELAWTELPEKDILKPIVVVLHGLEGSIDSHYAKGMMKKIKQQGWIGVLVHFRGCGKQDNLKAASYHSGFTTDIDFISARLQRLFPDHPKSVIGFSLGGNVLVQHLAKQSTSAPYSSAAVICAPLDLSSCSERINKGLSKIYQKYLVDMLKNSALKKARRGLVSHINEAQIRAIKTMWEFDEHFTAPINQFANAQDYYHRASGINNLNNITIPTLVIHAADDPFLAHEKITGLPKISPNIHFEVSRKGGHVGFIAGKSLFQPDFWLEQRTINYLEKHL